MLISFQSTTNCNIMNFEKNFALMKSENHLYSFKMEQYISHTPFDAIFSILQKDIKILALKND